MNNNTQLPNIENLAKPGKPYRKPQLVSLGDLRSLTLGGSFGSGESGSGSVRKVQMGLPQSNGILMPDGSYLMPDGSILPPNQQP